jgi:hypothetical protein
MTKRRGEESNEVRTWEANGKAGEGEREHCTHNDANHAGQGHQQTDAQRAARGNMHGPCILLPPLRRPRSLLPVPQFVLPLPYVCVVCVCSLSVPLDKLARVRFGLSL